ncbi:MAG: hypothetical protein AB1651_03515 [Pseudomonadota bacterium]
MARQAYVSALDVLLGIGWLDPSNHKRWRTGQVACLEDVLQTNLSRISAAMKMLHIWAREQGLRPSETAYVARTPQRSALRFSKTGDAEIERAYRTHWLSPTLSEKKRQRLQAEAAQPELVVIEPTGDWKCHRCGGSGAFLVMEPPGPACLRCVGLGDLEFLPAGDALVSRRAKALSPIHAVVMRFSRSRKRYQRQGILVKPDALRAALASRA